MCDMWTKMKYADDECREDRRTLSGLELARLAYLAEHPELENSALGLAKEKKVKKKWWRCRPPFHSRLFFSACLREVGLTYGDVGYRWRLSLYVRVLPSRRHNTHQSRYSTRPQ